MPVNDPNAIWAQRIETILEWAEGNPSFDTKFIEDLQEQLEGEGFLTDKQQNAVLNIMEKWHIEE